MDTLITAANTGYASTTGFSIDQTVSWVGDNLIKPFLGSGLATLNALKWWIVALVVITAIVYFAYRAFRFHRA